MLPTDKTKEHSFIQTYMQLDLDLEASSAIIEPELRIMTVAEPRGSADGASSSDEGMENVSYCEEDEAKLSPAGRVLGCEQSPSSPLIVIDYAYQEKNNANNTDTLFNLTASSPSKSPRRAAYRPSLGSSASQGGDDNAVSDGVVSLSPFRSVIASKERVNRLITNIFELENDRLR